VILAYHPDWVIEKTMRHFCVGSLSPSSLPTNKSTNDETSKQISDRKRISTSYRKLLTKLRNKDVFQTDMSFYLGEGVKFLVLWCLCFVTLLYRGQWDLLGTVASALLCAALWQQAAFVAHDGIFLTRVIIWSARLTDNLL
jgi:hypothetical protein